MSRAKIIRAWKDPDDRQRLSHEERSLLPANPAGLIELHAEDLSEVASGKGVPTKNLRHNLSFQWGITQTSG